MAARKRAPFRSMLHRFHHHEGSQQQPEGIGVRQRDAGADLASLLMLLDAVPAGRLRQPDLIRDAADRGGRDMLPDVEDLKVEATGCHRASFRAHRATVIGVGGGRLISFIGDHLYRVYGFALAFRIDPDNVDPVNRTFWSLFRRMITQKTKYALKSLMVLADEKAGGAAALRIEEIAARSGAPKRFLEHILLDLKRGGMIGSRRGRKGGYELIRDPRRVSLAEVLRLIDGPMAPLPCLSRKAYRRCDDCKDERTCRVRAVFGGFYATYILMIESLTLADLQEDARALERFAVPEPSAGE